MTRTPTRRHLLRVVGVAATTTLAGCSIGGEKGTSSGTTSNGQTSGGTTTAGSSTATDTGTGSGTTSETTTGTTESTEKSTETTQTGTQSPNAEGNVKFSTSSGTTVHGTILGDGQCGVVFAHDVGFDRQSWLPQTRNLADKGYTCLTIDLNLDDRSTTPGYVLAAIRYLRRRVGVKHVVLVGAGAGANAVVRANAQAKANTVGGTLAVAPGEGVDAAGQMQGWKLFVVSNGDDDEYVQTTKRMEKAAPDPKRLQTIGGSAHGQHTFETNQQDMRSLLNSLLKTVCGDG